MMNSHIHLDSAKGVTAFEHPNFVAVTIEPKAAFDDRVGVVTGSVVSVFVNKESAETALLLAAALQQAGQRYLDD